MVLISDHCVTKFGITYSSGASCLCEAFSVRLSTAETLPGSTHMTTFLVFAHIQGEDVSLDNGSLGHCVSLMLILSEKP